MLCEFKTCDTQYKHTHTHLYILIWKYNPEIRLLLQTWLSERFIQVAQRTSYRTENLMLSCHWPSHITWILAHFLWPSCGCHSGLLWYTNFEWGFKSRKSMQIRFSQLGITSSSCTFCEEVSFYDFFVK